MANGIQTANGKAFEYSCIEALHKALSERYLLGRNDFYKIITDDKSRTTRVEPSLKFDVQLISFPSSVYAQVEPWDIEDIRKYNRYSAYECSVRKK